MLRNKFIKKLKPTFGERSASHRASLGPSANDDHIVHTLPVTVTLEQPPLAMFDRLQNTLFNGGTFVQHNTVGDKRRLGLSFLRERVATAAFHNSAQRIDPPRCHPDTRVATLQRIYDWIIESGGPEGRLLWLNGAAGAGKSAIVQSMAEQCIHAAMAIASFFFFRADPTRNIMEPLVATLVYQLIQAIPETSDDILLTIESNPLIFDQSLEFQLQQLLLQPLLRLPKHLQRLFVIFIDGLDEWHNRNDQSDLIKVLGSISRNKSMPVIFLIASRREPQIEAEFVKKFKEIKDTHLHKHHLPSSWPTSSAVEEIVTKSSGQFIYASVVIGYVSSPRTNPAHQLDIIHGIRVRDPSSQNPFAHLDALYQYIFSQVEGLDKVLDILAFVLIAERDFTFMEKIKKTFLLETGELEVCFADLTSVIELGTTYRIKFLHASLPDFLQDKSRSESYHIDVDEYRTKLLCMFLERLPKNSVTDPLSVLARHQYERFYAITTLLKDTKASNRLKNSFMNFNFTLYRADRNMTYALIQILKFLKQMDFDDQGGVHRHVLELVAARFGEQWSSLNDNVKGDLRRQCPDLMDRIRRNLNQNKF